MSKVNWRDFNFSAESEGDFNINTDHSSRLRFQLRGVCHEEYESDTPSEGNSTWHSISPKSTASYDFDDKCIRCQEIIEELQEDKRQLGAQLIEQSLKTAKYSGPCRCRLKEDVETLQCQEICLLETIELKKIRIESLKESDVKLENDLESFKEDLTNKLESYNDIKELVESTTKSFAEKCQELKEKQKNNFETEKNIQKLRNDNRELLKQYKLELKKYDDQKKLLNNIKKKCTDMQDKIDQEKKTLISLDNVSTELRGKIKYLKSELEMQVESQEVHQKEVSAKTAELATLREEKENYAKLVDQLEQHVSSQKQALTFLEKCKKEAEKLIKDKENENTELTKKFDKIKEEKLKTNREFEKIEEELKTKQGDLKSLNEKLYQIATIKNENTNNRKEIEEKLLDMVKDQKEKLRAILDECKCYEVLYREAVLVKSMIESDNEKLEATLVHMNGNVEAVRALLETMGERELGAELEGQLVKHRNIIQALEDKANFAEDKFHKRTQNPLQVACCERMRREEEAQQDQDRWQQQQSCSNPNVMNRNCNCCNCCQRN